MYLEPKQSRRVLKAQHFFTLLVVESSRRRKAIGGEPVAFVNFLFGFDYFLGFAFVRHLKHPFGGVHGKTKLRIELKVSCFSSLLLVSIYFFGEGRLSPIPLRRYVMCGTPDAISNDFRCRKVYLKDLHVAARECKSHPMS